MENDVKSIALSGGPKAGKTSAKRSIKRMVEREYGYWTIFVGETATEVIEAGFIPPKKPTSGDSKEMKEYYRTHIIFQLLIMGLQIAKERMWKLIAKLLRRKTLLVFDRAVGDNAGYLEKLTKDNKLYRILLWLFGLTPEKVLEEYDGVICLETSAKRKKFGEQDINDTTKRLEDDDNEALEVDFYVTKGWKDHPNFVRIPATETPEEKDELIQEGVRQILERTMEKTLKK